MEGGDRYGGREMERKWRGGGEKERRGREGEEGERRRESDGEF